MKPINTGIYDFPRFIEGGFVYVDKTDRLYELAKPSADIVYYLRVVYVGVNYDPKVRTFDAVKTEVVL